MKKVKIGEISASAISLGCMRMAALDTKRVDEIMYKALESGINFFDHADIYGKGSSEMLFGEFLKRSKTKREDIKQVIAALSTQNPGIKKSIFGALRRSGIDGWSIENEQ